MAVVAEKYTISKKVTTQDFIIERERWVTGIAKVEVQVNCEESILMATNLAQKIDLKTPIHLYHLRKMDNSLAYGVASLFMNSRRLTDDIIIITCTYFLFSHRLTDSFYFSSWLFPYYYLFLDMGFFLYLNLLMD